MTPEIVLAICGLVIACLTYLESRRQRKEREARHQVQLAERARREAEAHGD